MMSRQPPEGNKPAADRREPSEWRQELLSSIQSLPRQFKTPLVRLRDAETQARRLSILEDQVRAPLEVTSQTIGTSLEYAHFALGAAQRESTFLRLTLRDVYGYIMPVSSLHRSNSPDLVFKKCKRILLQVDGRLTKLTVAVRYNPSESELMHEALALQSLLEIRSRDLLSATKELLAHLQHADAHRQLLVNVYNRKRDEDRGNE